MKLKTIMKIISSIIAIVLISVLANSCKKEEKDISSNAENQNADELLADAKRKVADEIKANGNSITIPINQKCDIFYVNSKTGELMTREQVIQNRKSTNSVHTNNSNGIKDDFISACNYDYYTTTLTSYILTENCLNSPNAFQITWTFQVSTDDNLVLTNPYTHKATSGQIKIYNGSTLVYTNTTVTNAAIVYVGPDVSTPGYYLYNVTFTSPVLANSYFGVIYSVGLGGLIQTDCNNAETAGISIVSPTVYQYPSTNPCERIDPIYPSNNATTKTITILGEDAAAVCSGQSGFVYPYWQEVQYSIDGGAYTNSLLQYSSSSCLFTNFLSKFYVDPLGAGTLNLSYTSLSPGNHTINFECRNHYYSSTVTPIGCNAGQNKYPLPTALPKGWADCTGAWSAPKSIIVYPLNCV